MIAVTLPQTRFEADVSTSVGLPVRPSSGPSLAASTDGEPAVFAVVINAGPARAGIAVDGPRNSQAVLDELVAVLERHFGNQVRVADLAISPAAANHAVSNAPADWSTEAWSTKSWSTAARSPTEPAPLRFGRLTIDAARHEVLVDDQPTPLTKSEFDLLSVLARRPGVVLTRREIVIASKGPNYPVDDRSIDVQMFNLRRKLGPVGRRLQTVRSVGYRFAPDAP